MKSLALLGVFALLSPAFAQDNPPTTQRALDETPARHEDLRQLQLQASEQRQSNWLDESAEAAGANLPADRGPDDKTLSPSAPEVQSYVAKLTNVVLTPGQLAAAASMLAQDDAKRILADLPRSDLREHDNRVRVFRAQWKVRYGEEFDLNRKSLADYYVLRGERSPEEAILVSHRIAGTGEGSASSAAPQAEAHPSDQERVATLVIPSNQKSPAIVIVVNNEQTGTAQWKLNTPATLTAQRLQRNLDQRMSRLLDGQAAWPADVREAYRLVTYQVLASFNDQPVVRPRERPANDAQPIDKDNPSLES